MTARLPVSWHLNQNIFLFQGEEEPGFGSFQRHGQQHAESERRSSSDIFCWINICSDTQEGALSASTIRTELSCFWGLPSKHSKPILSWRTLERSLQTVFHYRLILWLIWHLFLVLFVKQTLSHWETQKKKKKGLNNGPCGIPKPFWKSFSYG